eukprot:2340009-Rhodomonas_salina.1
MGINVNKKIVKVQKLSTRLAAACQPYLTAEMFVRIKAMFARHSAAGILRMKYPSADQVLNGVEMGFNLSGQWGKVLTFKWDKSHQI